MVLAIKEDRKRTGGGLFLTEFGLCNPDQDLNDTTTVECRAVLDHADEHLLSWIYADSSYYLSNCSEDTWVLRDFSRVYPLAVAGSLQQIFFDPDQSQGTVTFLMNTTLQWPTEIYVPLWVHYPNGFLVTVDPPTVRYSFQADQQILYIWPLSNSTSQTDRRVHKEGKQRNNDLQVTVQISPRPSSAQKIIS